MQEKFKIRLSSGNGCYHSVQNLCISNYCDRIYRTIIDAYQLILSRPGLPKTFLMAHSKAKLKSNGNNTSCFKSFLQETCLHIFVCLDCAIGFIQTLVLALPFHEDTKLSKNIIQYLPYKLIIRFLEFYALPHCIPPPTTYLTDPKYMISNCPISSKRTLTGPNNFVLYREQVKYTFIYLQLAGTNPQQNNIQP